MKNKTIAIIGSPGCGKTTNAAKLAITLAKYKQNVIIVSLDRATPAIPYILSNFEEQTVSLGDLLTRAALSQHEIAQACMAVPKQKHISVIGYMFGDYHRKYPKMVYERVYDFFYQLQALAPFVIIDCAALIEEDPASNLALEISDYILRFGSADLKGMSYFNTIDKLLSNQASFPKEKQITMVSNCWAGQNWQRVATQYGKVFDVLPHCEDLAYQFDEMSLWNDLTTREGFKYMNVMIKLTNLITGNMKTRETVSEIAEERKKERKEEIKSEHPNFLHKVLKKGRPVASGSAKTASAVGKPEVQSEKNPKEQKQNGKFAKPAKVGIAKGGEW